MEIIRIFAIYQKLNDVSKILSRVFTVSFFKIIRNINYYTLLKDMEILPMAWFKSLNSQPSTTKKSQLQFQNALQSILGKWIQWRKHRNRRKIFRTKITICFNLECWKKFRIIMFFKQRLSWLMILNLRLLFWFRKIISRTLKFKIWYLPKFWESRQCLYLTVFYTKPIIR